MFLQPIYPSIKKELERREKLVSKNIETNEDLLGFAKWNGRTVFARVTSYAKIYAKKDSLLWKRFKDNYDYDISDENVAKTLRLRHVLYAGSSNFLKILENAEKLRRLPITGGIYGYNYDEFLKRRKESNGQIDFYGFRPMAGITSINIDNKGRFGSFKELQISFRVNDHRYIELYELLYMSPGVFITVEFGYDFFFENLVSNLTDEEIRRALDEYLLPIDKPDEIAKIFYNGNYLKYPLNSKGSYDVAIGQVSTFSFKRDSEGYDCSFTVISPGSAPIDMSRSDNLGLETFSNHFFNSPNKTRTNVNSIYELFSKIPKNKKKKKDNFEYSCLSIRDLAALIGKTKVLTDNMQKIEKDSIDIDSPSVTVVKFSGEGKKFISSNEKKKSKKKEKEQAGVVIRKRKLQNEIYVSLGYLEEFANLIFIENGFTVARLRSINERIREIDNGNQTKKEIIRYPMLIRSSKNLFSLDAFYCILPMKEDSEKRFPNSASRISLDEVDGFNPNFNLTEKEKKEIFGDSDKAGGDSVGKLRNLLINVKLVYECFVSATGFRNALKALLMKIQSECFADFYEFDVLIDDKEPQKIKILDMNSSIDPDAFSDIWNDYSFKTNRNSILREIDLDSKIPSTFSAAALVSTTATSSKTTEGLSFVIGVTDLVASERDALLKKEESQYRPVASNQTQTETFNPKRTNQVKASRTRLRQNQSAKKILTNEDRLRDEVLTAQSSAQRRAREALIKVQDEKNPPDVEFLVEVPNYENIIQQIKNVKATDPKKAKELEKQLKETVDAYKKALEESAQIFEALSNGMEVSENYKNAAKTYFKKYILSDNLDFLDKDVSYSRLYPVEVSLTIDGISGLFFGNRFYVDALQDRYKGLMCFQITKVGHSITPQGWTTRISGIMRAEMRARVEKMLNQNKKVEGGSAENSAQSSNVQRPNVSGLSQGVSGVIGDRISVAIRR